MSIKEILLNDTQRKMKRKDALERNATRSKRCHD